MNESAERIEAVLPISRKMFRELASKFDGTIQNRGNAVDFNGNSENLAKAIKYLRSTNQKDIPLIIISNAFDTGYQVSPLNYNLNESAKINKLTKADGPGYSGVWQLPSGTPGLVATTEDFELVVLGTEEEGIQIMLQNDNGGLWFKDYPASKEKEAVADFKKMIPYLSDLMDAGKFARKFGLTNM